MDWFIGIMTGAVCVGAMAVIYGLLAYYNKRRKLKERFNRPPTAAITIVRREDKDNSLKKRFLEWVSSFGNWAVKDKEEASKTRFLLIQAGIRHPKGPAIYFGIRALGAFALPLPYLVSIVMQGKVSAINLVLSFLLSGLGFYLPQYILGLITRRRQDRIDKALPDVLDLLIVCMEAGLALQATINRVADEIRPLSKDLYNELQLTNAEMRTGINRDTALKNLGERTDVQSVKSLVALMIQSDKMGASIAHSLRTHAGFVRVKRAQKAEEIAARLPVKILFPMVFFIFPAIFIVILGPAFINISETGLLGK